MYKLLPIIIVLLFASKELFSQESNKKHNIKAEAGAYISNHHSLPFWFTANQNGLLDNNKSTAAGRLQLFGNKIGKDSSPFKYSYGADIFTQSGHDVTNTKIAQLFGSIQYRNIELTLGAKHRDIKYEGITSTGGDILWSGNSRSYPGYTLRLTDYFRFDFMPKWLSFKGEYGDYLLNDDRYAGNRTRLHHKNFFIKTQFNENLHLEAGLDHYCFWAGESRGIEQPSSFSDYLRVITGREGGSNAMQTDQMNAIGNHVGAYSLSIIHTGNTDWTFFYSHPFEDGSGREFQNYPDGNYGIYINRCKPGNIVEYISYDFTYTRHQSGNFKKNPGDSGDKGRGNDSYFSNGVYYSGYTYFNRIMGSPFFIPNTPENGITKGIYSSKFISHHIGLKGHICSPIDYKLMISNIRHYGVPLSKNRKSKQQHAYLELIIYHPEIPFEINIGGGFSRYNNRINGDSRNDAGVFVKIIKRGVF